MLAVSGRFPESAFLVAFDSADIITSDSKRHLMESLHLEGITKNKSGRLCADSLGKLAMIIYANTELAISVVFAECVDIDSPNHLLFC